MCETPCRIDRPDGTEIGVSVPDKVQVSEDYRLEFASWSDGGEPARTISVSGVETKEYAAIYTKIFRLKL